MNGCVVFVFDKDYPIKKGGMKNGIASMRCLSQEWNVVPGL
jgi:hypothetical protein